MIHTVVFEDKIKIWWDYKKLGKAEKYAVYLGDVKSGETRATNFEFADLMPETEYEITVALEGENEIESEKIAVLTHPAKRVIDVTMPPYLAVGNGKVLNTAAIQRALDDCRPDECVYIPDGNFLTGALDMKSNTELRLSKKAVLTGSSEAKDYLPKIHSRFEGTERECYRSLINTGTLDRNGGYNCENVIIRGGTIYGGGQKLRKSIIDAEREALQAELRAKGASDEEIYSYNVTSRFPGFARGRLFQIANTKGVVIADVTCGFSPSWNVHMIYSDDITTCGCKIRSKGISNGDGWDPDSSTNCILFDTEFDTGDDCVAIKSGINPEGNVVNKPTEHVKVFDCKTIGYGHGICIGSEMSGGVNDVTFWNCDVYDTFNGIFVKAPEERGGYVKNFSVYNCRAPQIKVQTSKYCCNVAENAAENPPVLENFRFEDLVLRGVERYWDNRPIEKCYAVSLIGAAKPGYAIKNVVIKNVKIEPRPLLADQEMYFENVENVTIENVEAE